MDGVNEVGEVKVSRLQMEGESEDKTPPEHKVRQEGEESSLQPRLSSLCVRVNSASQETQTRGLKGKNEAKKKEMYFFLISPAVYIFLSSVSGAVRQPSQLLPRQRKQSDDESR